MYRRPGRDGWYASFNRNERHISLDTDDEEQARINLADLINRRAVEGAAPKKGELGTIFVECATRAQVNHTTSYADDVSRRLERLAAWMDSRQIVRPDKISLAIVEQYKSDERMRGVTDRTINRNLDAWKKAMKLAVDDGYAPARVLTFFRKLREPLVEPHQRGLTMDDIDRVLKHVDDERYFWLFRTVVGTGMRDDEVRHLELDNIRDSTVAITPLPPGTCRCHPRGWTTKNYRYRVVPISHDTAAAARAYAEIKHAMNLDHKKTWNELHRARVAAGFDWEWSMHELRRAWASHLLASGVKLQSISQWLGHGDIKTTMRYLRVVENDMPAPEDLPL